MTSDMIRYRAQLLRVTREFFHREGYIEVDTPVLARSVIPEEYIDLFETRFEEPYGDGQSVPLYLAPSPERFMKPILGDYGGRIFQLGHCFRNRESLGNYHSPEFTMLEYYETGVDEQDLLRRTSSYLRYILRDSQLRPLAGTSGAVDLFAGEPIVMTVAEAFRHYTGIELFSLEDDASAFAARCRSAGVTPPEDADWMTVFNYAMADSIEPMLPKNVPVFLTDYPARSNVLARRAADKRIIRRWELYLGGVEIANCFAEEQDPGRVQAFFESQREQRAERGATAVPEAEEVIPALEHTPMVSGAALGFDRLLMLLSGSRSIQGVIFSPLHDSLSVTK